MTSSNVVQFANFVRQAPKANVVLDIIASFTDDYSTFWAKHQVDVENPEIAFDIATIHFLMQGIAHRTQGQTHPSQKILNTMRQQILGA